MNVGATYPLHTAAKAAGYRPREFRRLVDNGFAAMQGCDRTSTGTGDKAGYSRRRILQAATTKALTDLGVPTSRASHAAFQYSDVENIGRAPGKLYSHGKSLLFVSADSATVRNVFHDTSWTDITPGTSVTIVDLNRVAERVDHLLNTIS